MGSRAAQKHPKIEEEEFHRLAREMQWDLTPTIPCVFPPELELPSSGPSRICTYG